jgi:hypothetical protein
MKKNSFVLKCERKVRSLTKKKLCFQVENKFTSMYKILLAPNNTRRNNVKQPQPQPQRKHMQQQHR